MKTLNEFSSYRWIRLTAYVFMVLYQFGFYGSIFPFLRLPYTGVVGGALFGVLLIWADRDDWHVVKILDAVVLATLLIWPLTFNF